MLEDHPELAGGVLARALAQHLFQPPADTLDVPVDCEPGVVKRPFFFWFATARTALLVSARTFRSCSAKPGVPGSCFAAIVLSTLRSRTSLRRSVCKARSSVSRAGHVGEEVGRTQLVGDARVIRVNHCLDVLALVRDESREGQVVFLLDACQQLVEGLGGRSFEEFCCKEDACRDFPNHVQRRLPLFGFHSVDGHPYLRPGGECLGNAGVSTRPARSLEGIEDLVARGLLQPTACRRGLAARATS